MVKVIELTKENEEQYLDQIVKLEQITLEAMKREFGTEADGKAGRMLRILGHGDGWNVAHGH